ncbi:MAG: glucose-1-phosphate thymidylyltransferase [Candidatus Magasanikbacteria bacterium CG_4_9_14_3_um_filter_32_9]|uniref:Glucose-1-phosphate thymidylyltransferase n=1 Tax=Candidatus Magasanikbacteria bacterium CG_4_9_14_3_um_filter_32_9 TaxID=1974644 RepID=A0A2M7Z7P6_9BACT|nr:MAG: glucose-1-phosphate thymidylyltransferase [Candidatus Magasanikbacteria bacterium CG_4_9_14_3_um_filter_32_9]
MKIRKAVLTGGGRGTRLHPITLTVNKHLVPLANKPMIFHAIEKAVEAGIEEIFINTNPGETELQKYIGDGGHWDVKIKFYEQTGGPQGVAHVAAEAHKFIGDDPFMFYFSDNILLGSLKDMVDDFSENQRDCMLALSKVPDPERFGVPKFENGKIIDVLEKPSVPPSDFAVVGIYIYGPKVFFKAYDNIEKSERGEYEISSVNSYLIKNGYNVGHKEITGWWKDTGKPDDLLAANRLILEKMSYDNFRVSGQHSLFNSKKIHIGVGTVIGESVNLIEPVIIGENCKLNNCTIGPNTTIGTGTEINGAKISNSIILQNTKIDTQMYICDSLIGQNVTIERKKQDEAEGRTMMIGDKTRIEI